MFWIFLLIVVVAAVAAYKFRVPILAKVLNQPQSRVQRAIDKKKRS